MCLLWKSSVKARCETTSWKGISNSFTKQLNSKTTRQWVALNLCNLANWKQSGSRRLRILQENKLTTWNCAQFQLGIVPNIRHSAAEPLQVQVGSSWFWFEETDNHDICLGKVGPRKVSKKIKELSELSAPAISVVSALLEVTDEYQRHQDENTIAFLRAMASLSMSNWTLWINYYKFCGIQEVLNILEKFGG